VASRQAVASGSDAWACVQVHGGGSPSNCLAPAHRQGGSTASSAYLVTGVAAAEAHVRRMQA